MKAILPLFLAASVSSTFVTQAQTPATPPAAPAKPDTAPKEALSPAKEELGKVVEAIKAKLAAGKKSEEELKEELTRIKVFLRMLTDCTRTTTNHVQHMNSCECFYRVSLIPTVTTLDALCLK